MDDAASNSARNSVHREHLLKRYFVLLFIRAILLIKNEIENGFQKKRIQIAISRSSQRSSYHKS